MSKKSLLFNIFKVYTWNKMCSLACLQAKTEEKLKNKFIFPLYR